MSDAEELLRKAQAMYNLRRLMLVFNAAAYTVWMVGLAFNTGTAYGGPSTLWGVFQLIGPVLWILSLIGVLWTVFEARRRRDLSALIDDERTRSHTLKAFQVGYFALLFPPAIIYTASYFMPIDLRFVIPLLLAAGVATPSLVYALFYRN